jgi:aminodeoxyfutalosine deaminase
MEQSLLLRAAWVCPVARPPLRDAWVHVANNQVTAVGQGAAPAADRSQDLGAAIVLPGLVNAHAHLELSWLRGRVPPGPDFLTWVGRLMRARTSFESSADPVAMAAVRDAVAEMRASGTVAVGDIANALITPAVLADTGMPGVVFHELMGFRDADGQAAVAASRAQRRQLASADVRVVAAPHAPFSVSPELFGAIRDDVQLSSRPLTSVHVAESPEEVQLLRDGTGPWRERLEALGVWRRDWVAPGRGPGDYLCDLGVIAAGTLVVHGVQLTDAELTRVAECGATLVTCPRSNSWVGVGAPPVARFFAAGGGIAVGTDSLASTPDLNLFSELAELHRLAPEVAPSRLIAAATRGGAAALQLDGRLGVIAPGADARLIAVAAPGGTADPEAVLVQGVTPDRVEWVGAKVTAGAGGGGR